ncbi:MAG: tRNA (cytidine(56)-2'-O)-methyltransferase [Candidatus Hodarchaeales archaeon]
MFRIGHRVFRDKRITTHLALVARAFGAGGIKIAGEKDEKIIRSVSKVVSEWGGKFSIDFLPYEEWIEFLEEWKHRKGKIIHLTMYGENILNFQTNQQFRALKSSREDLNKLLVIVGGEKVPAKTFQYADWNIAITNQPHSEVGSLAIFLEKIIPNSLEIEFPNSRRHIKPSLAGKKKYRTQGEDDEKG